MSYAAKAKTQPSFKLLEYCRTNWYHHCQTFPLEDTKRSLPSGRGIADGESVTVYPSLKPGVEVMLKNPKQTSIFDLNIYAYCPLSPLPVCVRAALGSCPQSPATTPAHFLMRFSAARYSSIVLCIHSSFQSVSYQVS